VTVESRVLGFVVGLSYQETTVSKTGETYLIRFGSERVEFNCDEPQNITYFDGTLAGELPLTVMLKKDKINPDNDVEFSFTNVNILNTLTGNYKVIYLTGVVATSFDSWKAEYSNEYVLLN